jgi:hypothetical protein
MTNEELEELYMQPLECLTWNGEAWTEAEEAENMAEQLRIFRERTMEDTCKSFLNFLTGVGIVAGLSVIVWGLLYGALEGWKHMNAVTGWILGRIGL